jgi:acyl-CoA synthetase (AMP-forming)/AMP-acid ligase II
MMSSAKAFWGKQIAVEEIRGVPFRMYTDRPRRIEHLLAFAECWGARPYVVQGERTVTFDGLRRASAAKARQLVESGVGRGDRVLIFGWNSPDWILNFWACVRIGAIPVLGNAWWSQGELDHALNLLQPALVLADARGAAKIPSAWRRGPWAADENAVGAECPLVQASDENETAVIIFTSGTEGRAKGVVLAHRSLLANQQMLLHVTRRLPYRTGQTRRPARSACTPGLCSISAASAPCCAASWSATRWCFRADGSIPARRWN